MPQRRCGSSVHPRGAHSPAARAPGVRTLDPPSGDRVRKRHVRPPSLALTVVAVLAATFATGGCGRRESARDRVTRLRAGYCVQPHGFQQRRTADGTPELAIDVLVSNGSRDGLATVTLAVHVLGADGSSRAEGRAILDTAGLIPGAAEQRTALARGLEVAAGDSVTVELEEEPESTALPSYPEYRAALSAPEHEPPPRGRS